jgi:hypothetical protein
MRMVPLDAAFWRRRGKKAGPKVPLIHVRRAGGRYFIAASYISATWSQLTR